MSIVASFLAKHLIPALEAAFIAHEPQLRDELLTEVEALASSLATWVEDKIHKSAIAAK